MRRIVSVSNIALCFTVIVYSVISKLIFDNVYLTSKQVIDEEFHIPQGLAYCNYHFDTWNPKITTLPGLYLISAFIFAPLDMCLIYWLRFTSLAASILNLVLFYILFGLYNEQVPSWKNLFASLNLSILPPLYFFSHLYYTDMISLSFILMMFIFEKKERHILASVTGMISIIIRQTNIIWVLMVFGRYFVTNLFHNSVKKKVKKASDLRIAEADLKGFYRRFSVKNFALDVWLNLSGYLIVLITFLSFVIFNKGIVVGDKKAHAAAIHLPQIFYFSLFSFIFLWPYFIPKLRAFLLMALKRKILIVSVVVICFIVVYFNTMVHPYLLADNRHYTFYIWNRSYGKYSFVRYVMISGYVFFLYCILSIAYSKNDVSFALVYIPCTALVLLLQKMIEVRYFFVPYILLRLHIKNVSTMQLISEFIFSVIINYLTLDIFFKKNIYWVDYTYPQKLIW